jgi:phosphopantetheinyl transferase
MAGCEGVEERARHFVRLWTLKEAYVKAGGRGISAPPGLNAFSLTLQPRCGVCQLPNSMARCLLCLELSSACYCMTAGHCITCVSTHALLGVLSVPSGARQRAMCMCAKNKQCLCIGCFLQG